MTISNPLQDVLVIGFGAIGAMYSLILSRSGAVRVTAVARSNYDAVKASGVNFQSGKYGEIKGWRPDRLVRSIANAADRRYSYILITTKAIPELTRTSDLLAPFLSVSYTSRYPPPTYVVVQNGLNVEVDLYQALKNLGNGEPRIISTAVWTCANLVAPNVVQHNAFDKIVLGTYRYRQHTANINTPKEAAILEDIARILRAGGGMVDIVPEIQRMKFSKNFWNVAFASFATLTGFTLSAIFRPPPGDSQHAYAPYLSLPTANLVETYTIPTMKATLMELLALGRAMGFPDSEDGLPSSVVDNAMVNIRALYDKPESGHKPSMLLDAEKVQPIEVEVIVGEVVRMARELKVDVPRVETLYALLLVVQNQIVRRQQRI